MKHCLRYSEEVKAKNTVSRANFKTQLKNNITRNLLVYNLEENQSMPVFLTNNIKMKSNSCGFANKPVG